MRCLKFLFDASKKGLEENRVDQQQTQSDANEAINEESGNNDMENSEDDEEAKEIKRTAKMMRKGVKMKDEICQARCKSSRTSFS